MKDNKIDAQKVEQKAIDHTSNKSNMAISSFFHFLFLSFTFLSPFPFYNLWFSWRQTKTFYCGQRGALKHTKRRKSESPGTSENVQKRQPSTY